MAAARMRRLLVINPNTSIGVSNLLQTNVQAEAGHTALVRTVTARFGAAYISCEASYAVASHAALDAWAHAIASEQRAPDAVLVGCFGDPGLLALREISIAPVTGLAEAAFIEAARHGRFAVVTGGARWKTILQRLAETLGFGAALAGIHTVTPTGSELAADPRAAHALLAAACQEAARTFKADAIVLGGAGLAGMAAVIASAVDVPLIDSVAAGARHALHLASQPRLPNAGRFEVAWQNVSTELTALGR